MSTFSRDAPRMASTIDIEIRSAAMRSQILDNQRFMKPRTHSDQPALNAAVALTSGHLYRRNLVARRPKRRDQPIQMQAIAGFAFDIQAEPLHRQIGENALVREL